MTDLYCIRGCLRRDHHLPDCPGDCGGCEPRGVETGYLCGPCLDKLWTLLGEPDDRESIAGACAWLATNMGQHIRTSMGGKPSGDGSTTGEHMVTVMAAMSDLQIALVELAAEFAESRQMTRKRDTDPAVVAAWLRPWINTLADWEPIGDNLTHLLDLMREAHGAAPWRGRDPQASDQAAVVLFFAPAEPTSDIRERFNLTEDQFKKLANRHGLEPLDPQERPRRWRPWDVYAILHRQVAEEYEARLTQASRSGVVWSSDSQDVA